MEKQLLGLTAVSFSEDLEHLDIFFDPSKFKKSVTLECRVDHETI